MSTDRNKPKTRSFAAGTPQKKKNERFGYTPDKNEGRVERSTEMFKVRFKRKDLEHFEPQIYVTSQLKI